jgi:hypothetical protein
VKRPRHLAWNILAAASALLFVAMAAMWFAGRHVEKSAQWSTDPSTTYFLISSGGHVDFVRQSLRPMSPKTPSVASITFSTAKLDRIAEFRGGRGIGSVSIDRRGLPAQFIGFRWRTPGANFGIGGATFAARFEIFSMPYWCPMLLAALMAASAIARLRSRGKSTGDYCRECGYDLRATSDRCPECGAAK